MNSSRASMSEKSASLPPRSSGKRASKRVPKEVEDELRSAMERDRQSVPIANDDAIVIKNAKVHNLKGVSTVIPRDQLTVLTGPSGSGKSSLAFDTIYAEGQRRYVESLSAY